MWRPPAVEDSSSSGSGSSSSGSDDEESDVDSRAEQYSGSFGR